MISTQVLAGPAVCLALFADAAPAGGLGALPRYLEILADDDEAAEARKTALAALDVARRYLDGPSDSDDDDSDAFADEFVDFSDDDDAFDGDEELARTLRKRSIDIDDDADDGSGSSGNDGSGGSSGGQRWWRQQCRP